MMLRKKKLAALLAMTVFVTACGGGGGDNNETGTGTGTGTGGGAQTGTTQPIAGGDSPATGSTGGAAGGSPDTTTGGNDNQGGTQTPPDGTGNTPPGDGGTNPGTQLPDDGGNQSTDARLAGHLSMVANQLVFMRGNRSEYNAFELEQFETGDGLYDAAPGATGDEAGAIVPPSAIAPAAPIASFGFRIDRFVQATATEAAVGNQTVVGRVAFSLVERANSPEIANGEIAEEMRFVIDNVELTTNAGGELVGVRVRDNAQLHVSGVNAQGVPVNQSIAAPAASVRLLPVSQVLDNYGDASSTVLLFDLEHAFSQAGTRLAALENIAGQFDMDLTFSAANIVRPADAGRTERALTGKSITVGTQPTVTGSGISGTAWIRAYP